MVVELFINFLLQFTGIILRYNTENVFVGLASFQILLGEDIWLSNPLKYTYLVAE